MTSLSTTSTAARPVWRLVAGLEVAAAAVAVVADWLIPSIVLCLMAAASLAARRQGLGSLGLHRPARPGRLAMRMLALSVGLTLLDVGLLMPVTEHVSGRRQDLSDFADLEGDAGLLVAYLLLAWTLAAFAEELAFRGYLFTRLTDLLGTGRWGLGAALLLSSALFAVIHTEQGLVGAVVAGLDAMVMGAVRLWTGTLWGSVLVHGFDDTIGFVAFFLAGPFYGLW